MQGTCANLVGASSQDYLHGGPRGEGRGHMHAWLGGKHLTYRLHCAPGPLPDQWGQSYGATITRSICYLACHCCRRMAMEVVLPLLSYAAASRRLPLRQAQQRIKRQYGEKAGGPLAQVRWLLNFLNVSWVSRAS